MFKVIASVEHKGWGGADRRSTQTGSTVNFHFHVEKAITSVDLWSTSVQLLILGGGVSVPP